MGYGKDITEMTRSEIECEIESTQTFFNECAESGQGISTKETIRFRKLKEALATHLNVATALDIVADYKAARGLPGTLEALMAMQNDNHLSAIQMVAYDVAFKGFAAMFAPRA